MKRPLRLLSQPQPYKLKWYGIYAVSKEEPTMLGCSVIRAPAPLMPK